MLLLHIHDDRRTDTPIQICLFLANDGSLSISSSTAISPGLLFPTNLFDKKPEPTIEAFESLFQRIPIRILIDKQAPASSVDLKSRTSQNSSFDNAPPTEEKLLINKYGEVL